MNELQVWLRVHRLLTTDGWCQGRVRSVHGEHCLVGAVDCARGHEGIPKVSLTVPGFHPDATAMTWNDHPYRTHVEVLTAIDNRIRQLLAEGQTP